MKMEQLAQSEVFSRYRKLLIKTRNLVLDENPTSIIAIARKGPRLIQLMQELGIAIPEIPIFSEHAIDFLDSTDIGNNPLIFDDVVILGTTLRGLTLKIKEKFGINAHTISAVADKDNFCPQLLKSFTCAQWFNAQETQQFSSELIRAINLLALPYDLDHPIFSMDKSTGIEILKSLADKATAIHKENLSLQYQGEANTTIIHFNLHDLDIEGSTLEILGLPQIFKIKAITSKYKNDMRFVCVACFPTQRKAYIHDIWKSLNISHPELNAISKYRMLCFEAALKITQHISPQLENQYLMHEELTLETGPKGISILDQLIKCCRLPTQLSEITNNNENAATNEDYLQFEGAFNGLTLPEHGESVFEKICLFWQEAFQKVEIGLRSSLKSNLHKGIPVEEALLDIKSKRLSTGFTINRLLHAIGEEFSIDASLAIDLAVDTGVQVPIYAETNNIVGRVYHHGESVWDGMRFAALISKIFQEHKLELDGIPIINFEKYMVILYEIAENQKLPFFQKTLHYLSTGHVDILHPDAIDVEHSYRTHGRTLEVKSTLMGATSKGSPNRSASNTSAYWLRDHAHVFSTKGKCLYLAPNANEKYLTDIAVPKEIWAPVSGLFCFLTRNLPDEIYVKKAKREFSKEQLIRFLSSCSSKSTYLRAIAQDAILIAQGRCINMTDDLYWTTGKTPQLSGEIYQKWLVNFFGKDIKEELLRYFAKQDFYNLESIFIEPLFIEGFDNNYIGEKKIEGRCLTLFACIELLRNYVHKKPLGNKEKTIKWLEGRGFVFPTTKKELEVLADKVCREIITMFPALLSNLNEQITEKEEPPEVYIYSDMKDSSMDGEIEMAEEAKQEFVNVIQKLEDDTHCNSDLNDEKSITVRSQTQTAIEILNSLISVYSSRNKYARIGIVTSRDTGEKSSNIYTLPSSPTNFSLAKKFGCFLIDNDDLYLNKLDARHEGQQHGVIAFSEDAFNLLAEGILSPYGKEFEDIKSFLKSNEDGWVKVLDSDIQIGEGSKIVIKFSVYLYR